MVAASEHNIIRFGMSPDRRDRLKLWDKIPEQESSLMRDESPEAQLVYSDFLEELGKQKEAEAVRLKLQPRKK